MIADWKTHISLALTALLMMATPAGAHCHGSEDGAPRAQVQLCVETACKTADLSRVCGNGHYGAQEYKVGDVFVAVPRALSR